MKRLNDSSDVPEARLGFFSKNIYKLKKQGYILLARGKSGYSRLLQQKSRRKDSLW